LAFTALYEKGMKGKGMKGKGMKAWVGTKKSRPAQVLGRIREKHVRELSIEIYLGSFAH
jgi:hypothetical protein